MSSSTLRGFPPHLTAEILIGNNQKTKNISKLEISEKNSLLCQNQIQNLNYNYNHNYNQTAIETDEWTNTIETLFDLFSDQQS